MFVLYSLEGCPYSSEAEHMFRESSAPHVVVPVQRRDKERYKVHMSTFPQIFYATRRKNYLLGGLSDLKRLAALDSCPARVSRKVFAKVKKYF